MMVYYQNIDFERKAGAIADLLRRRDFHVELHSGSEFRVLALLKSSPDLWVGFWNEVPADLMPKNYIFLNSEPLGVKKWSENKDWFKAMRGAKQIWSYTMTSVEHLKTLGAVPRFVPFGYAPYYETIFRKHTADKCLEQDIDVLFFGEVSERRGRILDELKRNGMNVHVAGRDNPAYGERLDELLARSKIVLGIHYYEEPEAQIADLARLDHLLSNQLFVVHEKPSALAANLAFEQNVSTCDYKELSDVCAYFIARPKERAERAARAYNWFKSEYALDSFIPYEDVRQLLE